MKSLLLQANALSIPLASESVHAVFTSPPYYNAREEYASWPAYADYLADMAAVWAECYRVLCDGGRIAVNVPLGYGRPGTGGYILVGSDTAAAILAAGFELRGVIVWYKTAANVGSLLGTAWGTWQSARNPSLRDSYELIIVGHKGDPSRGAGKDTIDSDTFLASTEALWKIPPAPASWHPAPFPPEIPRRLIELYTFAGDVVLDPFSGSGTTVQVARKLGRAGIGLDLSMEYLRRSALPMALDDHEWDRARSLKKQAQPADLGPLFRGLS